MEDIKIGVIGIGGRGALAENAHTPGQGSRIVACCDLSDSCLAEARDRYGRDTFLTTDYRSLLERDLDAVFITTPDYWHEEHAIAALESGRAVYLEKPMAITIAGSDLILETAMRTRSRLYLGHNMRYFPFVVKMKQLIDDGAIGRVKTAWCRHFVGHGGDYYFKDWHAERRYSTSLLLQKAAHDIDVLHWLCGGYTECVTAMGDLTVYGANQNRVPDGSRRRVPDLENAAMDCWPPAAQTELNPTIDVEDISLLLMRLDNGVLASYQQCHFTPDYWRNYTIIGDEGRIENDGDMVRLWNRRHDHHPEGDMQFPSPISDGSHGGADPLIVAEFIRFVRDGGVTVTSPVAARNSVAAGYEAAYSLRHGSIPREIPKVRQEIIEYFTRQP